MSKKAPMPRYAKKGHSHRVVKVIHELEKASSEAVFKYVNTDNGEPHLSHRQVKKALDNAKHRGYVIRSNGIYMPAPITYYNERQAVVTRKQKRYNRKSKRKNGSDNTVKKLVAKREQLQVEIDKIDAAIDLLASL